MHRLSRTLAVVATAAGTSAAVLMTALPRVATTRATMPAATSVAPAATFANTLVASVAAPTKVAKLPDGRLLSIGATSLVLWSYACRSAPGYRIDTGTAAGTAVRTVRAMNSLHITGTREAPDVM